MTKHIALSSKIHIYIEFSENRISKSGSKLIARFETYMHTKTEMKILTL